MTVSIDIRKEKKNLNILNIYVSLIYLSLPLALGGGASRGACLGGARGTSPPRICTTCVKTIEYTFDMYSTHSSAKKCTSPNIQSILPYTNCGFLKITINK